MNCLFQNELIKVAHQFVDLVHYTL
jgi:hypothetical protein